MLYKERLTGMRLSRIPEVDLSVVIAMFLLITFAWGVAKLESSFVKVERVVPVFTVSTELSVMPVIEAKTNKNAVKVGSFMSLAKPSAAAAPKTAVIDKAGSAASENMVLSQASPASAGIFPPKIVYRSIPDYPVKAIEGGMQGTAVVKIFILKNGRVGDAVLEQTSGHEILDRSAIAGVSQWRFEPAVSQKEAIEAWFKIPVKFQLKS
ncbi:MAG: energy transducer TonB [Candidatus Saganbacteria bacterium]|nr:energy transducer TonB [Candidatus Saganbacteria bacterium]